MAGIILASERQETNIKTSRNYGKTFICKGKNILFIFSILICDRVGQNKAK
jgi:hypothetical protein